MPADVVWSYAAFWLIVAVGVVAMFVRCDWQSARGIDKLVLFGPIFYAAPLGGFGVEHFTLTKGIASLVPKFIPWHMFWAYFIGACFIAAAFSLVTKIADRLAAALVALTFFLFVVTMDLPAWIRHPESRFALTFVLRELSFCAAPLAYATDNKAVRTIARCSIAIAVLFYGYEQFLHGDHVPGIPLEPLTPPYVWGHGFWTYACAVAYAIFGALLLINWRPRLSAASIGITVLVVELAVYVPIAIVERASLDNGFNYMADTLMFAGAVLMLAGAMPRTIRA